MDLRGSYTSVCSFSPWTFLADCLLTCVSSDIQAPFGSNMHLWPLVVLGKIFCCWVQEAEMACMKSSCRHITWSGLATTLCTMSDLLINPSNHKILSICNSVLIKFLLSSLLFSLNRYSCTSVNLLLQKFHPGNCRLYIICCIMVTIGYILLVKDVGIAQFTLNSQLVRHFDTTRCTST